MKEIPNTIRSSYAQWLIHQSQSTWDELQRLDLQRLAKLDARARGRSGEVWAKRQQQRARSRERGSHGRGEKDSESTAVEGARTASSKPMLLARMERLESHTTSQPASPFFPVISTRPSSKVADESGNVVAATSNNKDEAEVELPGLRGGLDDERSRHRQPALRNPTRLGHTLYTQPRRIESSPDELDVLVSKAINWSRGILSERDASAERDQERRKKLKAKISRPVQVEHNNVIERVNERPVVGSGPDRVEIQEDSRPTTTTSEKILLPPTATATPALRRRSTAWGDFYQLPNASVPTSVAPTTAKPAPTKTKPVPATGNKAQKPKPLAFLKSFARQPKVDAGRRPSDESFCCVGQSEEDLAELEQLERQEGLSEAARSFLATNKPLPMPLQYQQAALAESVHSDNAGEGSSAGQAQMHWPSAFQTALPPAALAESVSPMGDVDADVDVDIKEAYLPKRKAPPAPLALPPPQPAAATTEPPYEWRQSRVPFFRTTPPKPVSPPSPHLPAKDFYGRPAPVAAGAAETPAVQRARARAASASSSVYSVSSQAADDDAAGRYWTNERSDKTVSTFYDLDQSRGTWVATKRRTGGRGREDGTGSGSQDSESTFYDYEDGRNGFVAKRRTHVPEGEGLAHGFPSPTTMERPAPLRIAKVEHAARKRSVVAVEDWEDPFEYDDYEGFGRVVSPEEPSPMSMPARPRATGRAAVRTLLRHTPASVRYSAFEWEDEESQEVPALSKASPDVSPLEEGEWERRVEWDRFRRGLRATKFSEE
ncbi:hypothetical protein K490DRAFT_53607 [Saccharata proteae CBS 121410]|uniref:Uncharacterized protein n=1 Tax=Saccharata proteae CBS 121410 TaxID=1314787 RepID=A0A9P4M279_9PEZI|nr:hypothetical protein K490DRAFT_53607 [Saccharata proteae CBS 121410]